MVPSLMVEYIVAYGKLIQMGLCCKWVFGDLTCGGLK